MRRKSLLSRLDGGDRPAYRPGPVPQRGRRSVVLFIMTALLAVFAACGTSTTPGGNAATPTPSATASTQTTVKVYFSKHPESDSDPTAVFAVTRVYTLAHTPVGNDLPSFALEELLKGPTQAEQSQGYYTPFSGALALMSNCSGEFRDFDLFPDQRGTKAEPGTVTLRFCRRVDIRGDLDGPRMKAEATQTLLQFSQFKNVVILDWQGNCFDDLSGQNLCLK